MKKLLLVTTALFLSFPALAQQDDLSCLKEPKPSITINATADAKVKPDLAVVSAGVVTNALTAKKANEENRTKMTALFKTLKEAAIAEKDIQTSNYSVSPQYAYENNRTPRITGYQVNNMVTVKIRDMEKIGAVMDALITVGGNQLSGPSFTVDEPESFLDTARAEAVKKAVDRANLYANAAGLKIVKVTGISEGGGYMPPQPYMMNKVAMAEAESAGAAAPMPVAAGEMNLQASVSMSFELAPK